MNNRALEKAFWIGFAVLCPLIPVSLYFAGNWYSLFHSYSMGMLLGIISYVYFLNALIISARIRYFDSIFGHDRVLVFHGYLALAAMSAAVAHYVFKSIYSFDTTLQTGLGVLGFYLFATIIVLTLLFMVDTLSERMGWLKTLRTAVKEKLHLDYSKLKIFHNFTSLAAVFIALHVLMASSTQENLARMLVMGGWALVAVSFFLYHKFIRTIVAHYRSLSVTKVTPLTSSIVEISMKGSKRAMFRAGQFGYFRLKDEGVGSEEHPFTISSPPGDDGLVITVKNLGDYTAKLHAVQVGTRVLFDGPYGVFTPKQSGKHHLFIAGGIGITPFLSIITEWERAGIQNPSTLIWSTRTEQEMTHREFFEKIGRQHSLFRFIPIVTRPESVDAVGGRVTGELLDSAVKGLDLGCIAVYFCGPEKMRVSVTKELCRIGIPGKNIHFEKFSF